MSDRRRLRSASPSSVRADGSTMPEELTNFRPADWRQPEDDGPWPAWRRHNTAFLTWTGSHGWTRRQAAGYRHPSRIPYGWADEPPFRRQP